MDVDSLVVLSIFEILVDFQMIQVENKEPKIYKKMKQIKKVGKMMDDMEKKLFVISTK